MPELIFWSATAAGALVFCAATILGASAYKKQREELNLTRERLQSAHQKIRTRSATADQHEKRVTAITAFSATLNQSHDIQTIIKTAIDMVLEIMQVEVVILFGLDDENHELRILGFEGVKQKYASVVDRMKLGRGTCGRVAVTGQPLLIKNIITDPVYSTPAAAEEQLKSQISVALQSRGKIVGTLCVATRSEREFTPSDIELLNAIGNLIGIAMENSALCFERETANRQLKASEKRYRQLFERAHDAIWVQDSSGKIVAANQACSKLFGCSLSELTDANIDQFIEAGELESFKQRQATLAEDEDNSQPYRQRFVKKDGTPVTLMLSTNLLSRNGSYEQQFIGRDITNEVQMQENQQFYLKQITKAHEEERLRISRELHDSSAQNLIGMLRQLEDFCQTDEYLPMPRLRSLWSLHERLKDTLEELRRLSRDLRPSLLDDLGLLPAVDWLIEQLQTEYNISASLTVLGEKHLLSPETETTLFRIIQEALRNIAKHAEATKAHVSIVFGEEDTRVAIVDNGKGLKLPSALGELSRQGKLGIDGMQTRAKLVGGTFNIEAGPDSGTIITVKIPT